MSWAEPTWVHPGKCLLKLRVHVFVCFIELHDEMLVLCSCVVGHITWSSTVVSLCLWQWHLTKPECGPMPNVMVALPNIGGALCSTPQSLADAHYLTSNLQPLRLGEEKKKEEQTTGWKYIWSALLHWATIMTSVRISIDCSWGILWWYRLYSVTMPAEHTWQISVIIINNDIWAVWLQSVLLMRTTKAVNNDVMFVLQ